MKILVSGRVLVVGYAKRRNIGERRNEGGIALRSKKKATHNPNCKEKKGKSVRIG